MDSDIREFRNLVVRIPGWPPVIGMAVFETILGNKNRDTPLVIPGDRLGAADEIPGPGYGPLEGAVENHGTQVNGPAGRPTNTCATCKWFMLLSPGHAAICGERWRHVAWNAEVPLTTADESCDNHEARASPPCL